MGVLVTYATDAAVIVDVAGSQPNGCFAHKFGNDRDSDSLFDPSGYGEVKLKATNGGAGGAASVVLQQLRR